MKSYNFGTAVPREEIVHGACRPGHPVYAAETSVEEWLRFLDNRGITRVCCLLDDPQLGLYDGLLETYRGHFGIDYVCHAPLSDYTVVAPRTYHGTIAPFLHEATNHNDRVVVHCSAGQGRTGHLLALWVAEKYDWGIKQAVQAVQATGRSPLEAATLDELRDILWFGSESGG
jgi:protein-tyrosine phosphatase